MKKWLTCGLLALLAVLLTGSALAADGHNWQWEIKETGHMRYCAGCATHDNKIYDMPSADTHTYRCLWPETEPTGGQGSTYIDLECSVCGWSEKANVFLERGKDSTCTTNGFHIYEYKGKYEVSEKNREYELPLLEHLFQDYKPNHDATCTTNETETSVCAYSLNREPKCTATDTRDIPNSALGHDPEHHDAKAATCTEAGWDAYDTCKRCDYVSDHKEYAAKGHDLVKYPAKNATCTEKGWDAYEACKNCDYVSAHKEYAAKGHDLVQYPAKAATCTEKGWDAYEACKNCDYVSAHKEYAAKGHDLVKYPAKAATCTEKGWDAYEACKNCDYVSDHKEYAAKGHDLVKHPAKDATCTEKGWDAYESCKNCDYTTYVELPALGHTYEARVIKPTCTEDGCTRHTCTRCGDHYSDGKTAKLGHWFGEWAPEADDAHTATCLRDGCGHTALVECTRFNYALKVEGIEIPYVLSLCPICGQVRDDLRLERVENATAQAVNEHSVLPDGELTVRMGALENGERVMSVVFEWSGQPTQPDGEIQISLPAEVLTGSTLALLDEDSVETPLDFTVNDETATFTLDFTDAGTPMALIRLIPAE